jgi:hypothetical protein
MYLFITDMSKILMVALLGEHAAQKIPEPYGGFTEGVHLFPFRTEQLSPSWPMVLD